MSENEQKKTKRTSTKKSGVLKVVEKTIENIKAAAVEEVVEPQVEKKLVFEAIDKIEANINNHAIKAKIGDKIELTEYEALILKRFIKETE